MDEIESKEQKPKLCKLAVLSPLLLLFLWLFGVVCISVLPSDIFILIIIVNIICWVIFISSIVVGVLAIYKIHKSHGKLRGNFVAILGIVIALFIIILGVLTFHTHDYVRRDICRNRLKWLGRNLNDYSRENEGKYPAPDKWCDSIKENVGKYNMKEGFICPSSDDKKCSYAINPNCEPDSPNDVVLLFETKDGWNQFGGPEILTQIHIEKTCNVLFNDDRVKFVKPDEIGKLKWKAD